VIVVESRCSTVVKRGNIGINDRYIGVSDDSTGGKEPMARYLTEFVEAWETVAGPAGPFPTLP
jgi:hypothetical protein